MNFLSGNKLSRILMQTTAGVTNITTDMVDTANYEDVTFIVSLGTVTDLAKIKVQVQGDDNADGLNIVNLKGANLEIIGSGDSGALLAIEVYKPHAKRFLRLSIDRTEQNSRIDGVIVVLSEGRVKPVNQDGIKAALTILSPEVETA